MSTKNSAARPKLGSTSQKANNEGQSILRKLVGQSYKRTALANDSQLEQKEVPREPEFKHPGDIHPPRAHSQKSFA